jgi:hypothetical protein
LEDNGGFGLKVEGGRIESKPIALRLKLKSNELRFKPQAFPGATISDKELVAGIEVLCIRNTKLP